MGDVLEIAGRSFNGRTACSRACGGSGGPDGSGGCGLYGGGGGAWTAAAAVVAAAYGGAWPSFSREVGAWRRLAEPSMEGRRRLGLKGGMCRVFIVLKDVMN